MGIGNSATVERIGTLKMNKHLIRDNAAFLSRAIRFGLFGTGLTLVSAVVAAQTINDSEDLHITIESGDTFTGIVSRELIALDAWGEVARYNKLESPDTLRPGDVIVIPAEVLKRRNYAQVVFVKGKAIHHNVAKDTKVEVTKGSKIYPGDMIETDENGFVSLSFAGGSSVNLQPDSTMRIDILACIDKEAACEINLRSERGQLGLEVKNVGFEKPTVFSIDSPYASAAVRGTKFDFDVDEGNVLGVTDGTVEISLNGIRNDIPIGKGVLAGEGKSINDTFDLLVEPPIRLGDNVNRVSAEDVISWENVQGAEKYLVAYATGEVMQDILVSRAETGNVTPPPSLATGDYYISTRAVDANGLRGFSGKRKFARVKVDQNAAAPELELVLSDSQMQVSTAAGTGAYEVKIGNALETIESTEFLIGISTHELKAGETITLPIDVSKQWYIQGRKIVNNGTVSPYGALYFFDKQSR